jgi:hypothetical protein
MMRLLILLVTGGLLAACSDGAGAILGGVAVGASSVSNVSGVARAETVSAGGAAVAAVSFGHPVYTQAQIDAWSAGSAEYSRLAGSWAGNVNRTLRALR